jgi:hypothetical protein
MISFNDFIMLKESIGTPIQTGITKISQKLENAPFSSQYGSLDVIRNQFSLSSDELNELLRTKIIYNNQGWKIDKNKFQNIANHIGLGGLKTQLPTTPVNFPPPPRGM